MFIHPVKNNNQEIYAYLFLPVRQKRVDWAGQAVGCNFHFHENEYLDLKHRVRCVKRAGLGTSCSLRPPSSPSLDYFR